MFNHSCSEQSFILGVILFMYGHIQDRFIRLSYLSTQNLQILRRYASHEKWLAEA